nr:phosphodiesterase [Compostimonas suwonensis]
MGQHGEPDHVLVHLSDTHFLGGNRALYGRVDTDRTVERAFEQLERSGIRPEAVVITGDIADLGEADAYARVRGIIEPAVERLGAQLVWVMGNHDERNRFREQLLGEPASLDPVDRVYRLGGLRLIVLDTTVPGYHHGELAREQLDWLSAELSAPAPHGTLLALHHPPVPTPLAVMTILELQRQHELAEVVSGSDVRAILGGHLHYSTTSTFAGIPVSVAAATCYTMDLSAPVRELSGVDGAQSINLVHVYGDRTVHSTVPIGDFERVAGFDADFLDRMEALSPEERIEAFSRHTQPSAI